MNPLPMKISPDTKSTFTIPCPIILNFYVLGVEHIGCFCHIDASFGQNPEAFPFVKFYVHRQPLRNSAFAM